LKKQPSLMRSVRLGAFVLVGLLIYAYGFQVTQVNLDNIQSPERQTRLVRIVRALFRPDLFEYEREEFEVTAPIYVPCPASEAVPAAAPATGAPYLVVTPPCADPRSEVTIEGFNFEPNTSGPLNFVPPSSVKLTMTSIETDADGHFVVTARLPNRPAENVQTISAVTRRNVGAPHLSRNGLDTWDKIIETIFLALLATTLATVIAVPLSFFAARNLMKDVTASLMSIALSILAWPFGLLVGAACAGWLNNVSQILTATAAVHAGSLLASAVVMLGSARWALPPAETRPPSLALRLARLAALLVAVLAGVLALFLLAQAAATLGTNLQPSLGRLAFLGEFISDLGDILRVLIIPLAALLTGALLGSLASRLGQTLQERLSGRWRLSVHFILGALGGAVLAVVIGAAIAWLYEIGNLTVTRDVPAAAGAVAGLALAYRTRHGHPVAIGLTIYYVIRTIFNTLRSIEALIVAVVMVVWVGLGPFAGALALALHSIAAGGKLYSEQVESIMAGPLEAIKATGATRLQTIIYAVIPQIIPPYISFTMYRWDINVRMSTIIGFVGGGGIGFLLQQNMNLLNYRGAAAQILAIAIVVALMDYLSSRLRERAI
jgi:phosphonate ABC transporter permease subunit PhnE